MRMKQNKNSIFTDYISGYFLTFTMTFILLACSGLAGAAEYVYISDNLRVGVRPEPVSGVPPISVVFTGMRLEVHEKRDGYVKITTNKGVSGWIKDIYVTKKAPAIIQLNEFKTKYEKLKKELSQGGDTVSILEKANLALSEEVSDLKQERREWSQERAELVASQYKESSVLWIFGIFILILLSFVAGVYWYKTVVMKRLGGLRV